jgi:hypothetical protein
MSAVIVVNVPFAERYSTPVCPMHLCAVNGAIRTPFLHVEGKFANIDEHADVFSAGNPLSPNASTAFIAPKHASNRPIAVVQKWQVDHDRLPPRYG